MNWALSFSYILAVYGVFLFFEYCLSSGGIFFFLLFICRRCFVCIYSFITLVSCSVYFGRVSPWRFLWRAGSYFSAWGSAVWRVGPVLFIWVLAWGGWRGCTGFFFSGALLWWVRYDWNSGEGVSVFLWRLQFAVCSVGRRLSVVGLHFSYNSFIWFYSGIICRYCVL